VAQAAWYCDDDTRVGAANQLLEDCGRAPQAPSWHAAFSATGVEEAKALFDEAIVALDELENGFQRIAVRVATALLLPTQRRRLLEARVIAQRIESPPLQASLELLIDSPEPSDYGIFRNLATRVARSPLKVSADALYIDVVRGEVRRGGEVLHVSDRGFELLAALALLPAGTSKEELAAAIWPSLDGEAALNTLKMCVSRARAQVGERDAILSTKGGYALSERVAIDIRDFERTLRSARGVQTLSSAIRRQIEAAARALGARQRGHTAGWAWFGTHANHLDDLQHELMLALAQDSLRRDDVALKVAEPV
jgi:DNA-binding winged helix-turn-helix (wHTH) protein